MPVARLVADTAAPTITAPLASVTVPTREPVAPATHNRVSSESPAASPSSKRLIPPSLLQPRGCWLILPWSPGGVAGSANAKCKGQRGAGSGRTRAGTLAALSPIPVPITAFIRQDPLL